MATDYKEIILKTDKEISKIENEAQAKIYALQTETAKILAKLFTDIGWTNWDTLQLSDGNQYARFQKAITGKMKLKSIDWKNKKGKVESSQIYDVNENGCTCKDFAIRRLPCKHMIFLAFQISKHLCDNSQITLDVSDESDSSSDFELDKIMNKYEKLACCSLYRQCSEEGRCLQTDTYYESCEYKRNLNKGKVFYTKKSDLFSEERYKYLEDFRNSLNEGDRIIFDEILTYFNRDNRGTQNCFCLYNTKVKDMVERCKAFEMLSSEMLVQRIFDVEIISLTKADKLHTKYSKLPKPELIPKISKQANETQKEKEKREKENKVIDSKNLKIWEELYLSDPDLGDTLSKEFLYFRKVNYNFELNEFFISNYNEIVRDLEEVIIFKKANPKEFRDHLV